MVRGQTRAAKPVAAAAAAAPSSSHKKAKAAAAKAASAKQQSKGSNKSAPIELEDDDDSEQQQTAAAEAEQEESKEPPRTNKPKSKRTTELSRLAGTAAAASSSSAAAAAAASDSATGAVANGGPIECSLHYDVEEPGGVPVFRPNMEQFKDFAKFIEAVNNVGHYYGLVKVIPPPEYVANPKAFENVDLSDMKIQSPVRQNVSKTAMEGAYTVRAMEDPAITEITVPAFQGLTMQAEANRSGTEKKQMLEQDWDALERQFWRATMYNAPMYGADSPGTLFDPAVKPWNVAELPSLLHALNYEIPGVTLPFLYFGQWKSMFAFHKEDVNLYSINYLHVGAPKQWYGIPPRFAATFESKAHLCYADAARTCKEYMRHKEQLVSPTTLRKWLVPFIHTRQKRGEFMLTWPTAYHQGFNYGFNCAESVNFASCSWLPFGTNCGRCLCKTDTVWVEVTRLKERLRCLQWLYRAEQKQRRGAKPLTPADVPQSYVLDDSSIWLGLPTEVPELTAFALKYYPDDKKKKAEAGGRSMAATGGGGGRSMAAASSASSGSGYLFDQRSYNDMETNTYDESNGYMDDANASFCSYADCTQPLYPNHKALMNHYRTVHSAAAVAARAAAAASTAAAAAASSGATVAAAALPVPAATAAVVAPAVAASAASASKKKQNSTTVSGSKRKADAEPAAAVPVAPSKSAASRPSAAAVDSDAPVVKKQKQKQTTTAAAPTKAAAKTSAAVGKRR